MEKMAVEEQKEPELFDEFFDEKDYLEITADRSPIYGPGVLPGDKVVPDPTQISQFEEELLFPKKTLLKPFGYEVFAEMSGEKQLARQGPIGPNYVVGPGNGFQIYIWGREEAAFDEEINVEGDLVLPRK